jgi:hypothetical protein
MQKSTAVTVNAQTDVFAYESSRDRELLPQDSVVATNVYRIFRHVLLHAQHGITEEKYQGLRVILM